jgi:hypothetical protein
MEPSCPRCGEPARPGDRFCGRCGQVLQAAPAAAEPQPRRWSWLWAWVPLAAALAVLVLTNPSRQAYADWLAKDLAARSPVLAGRVPPEALAAAIRRATIVQDELVFTVFDTRLRGLRVDVLGVLGHFIPLGAAPAD